MNVNQAFPSKYLSGCELQGPVKVTIASVKEEELERPGVGKVTGYILYVEKASKGVILSRTLALQIAAAVGEPDMSKWDGRQVVLFGVPMMVGGMPRVAIRARAVAPSNQDDKN